MPHPRQVRRTLEKLPIAAELELSFVDLGDTYSDGFARSLLAAQPLLGDKENFLLVAPNHIYDQRLIDHLRKLPLEHPATRPRLEGDEAPAPAGYDAIALCEPPRAFLGVRGRPPEVLGLGLAALPKPDADTEGEDVEVAVTPCASPAGKLRVPTGPSMSWLPGDSPTLEVKTPPEFATTSLLVSRMPSMQPHRAVGRSESPTLPTRPRRSREEFSSNPEEREDVSAAAVAVSGAAAKLRAAEVFGRIRAVESVTEDLLTSDLVREFEPLPKPPKHSRDMQQTEAQRADDARTRAAAHQLPEQRGHDVERAASVDAIEAGLYLCSPNVFASLTTLALQLPYFTFGQGLQLLAAEGRLGAVPTGGLKWFAVETPDQLALHTERLAGSAPAAPADGTADASARSAATADEARRSAVEVPASPRDRKEGDTPSSRPSPARRKHIVKALSTFELPSEVVPEVQQARYHILAEEDGGDFSERPCFLSGGAGMLTTAHDYLRFSQVHIYILSYVCICRYR